MKKKVAIIDHLGAHGSSHHFYLFGQAQGLIENNVLVNLYTNASTINPEIKDLGFYQFYKRIFNTNKIIAFFRYFIGSLRSHIHAKISKCNIFHYHLFGSSALVVFNMILAKIFFAKICLTIHDVKSFSNKSQFSLYSKLIYFFADIIITHNKFSADEIISNYSFLENKIQIIPHGNYIPFIEIEKDKNFARQKIGINENKFVLLFFGMIKSVKGLDVLLKAMPEIIKNNKEVILLIAGKPWRDDFSKYEEIIKDLKIEKYCKLDIKFIDHNNVSLYYASSDIVVLPYRRIYQSGVLMMSLCYKKPVIVSDLPSFKEIIVDQETGVFFSSDDSLSLAHAVSKLMSDNDLMELVRKNAYNLMEQKFSWQRIGMLTNDAYNKISYFYKK